jgi:hypothetical protein
MTTDMKTPKAGALANEPVVIGAFVTWLLSLVGTFLIGHTHWVTTDTWGSLSTFLVPAISAVVITGVAWLVRNVVTPVWKVVTKEAQAFGISPTELESLLRTIVNSELSNLKTQIPAVPVVNVVTAGEGGKPSP